MNDMSLVRRIAARPSIVFEALTTEEGLCSWWGPADIPALSAKADVKVGGSFRVSFHTADGLEHVCAGQFLEIEPPRLIVMSWQWIVRGEPGEEGRVSRVEFRLRPIDTGTELTLIHADLVNEVSARDHEAGWAGALVKFMRRYPSAASHAVS